MSASASASTRLSSYMCYGYLRVSLRYVVDILDEEDWDEKGAGVRVDGFFVD